MEEHAITSLVVVDGSHQVRGFLHLHSLLAAGVV